MSDIQEEQKRLYKRAEENDYISKLEEIKDNLFLNKNKKETYLYEENSFQNMIVENKYYENKINELQDRIDKAVKELINIDGNLEYGKTSDRICYVIDILKGE